jgi:hypothetical protein
MNQATLHSIIVMGLACLLAGNTGCPLDFGQEKAEEDPITEDVVDMGGSEGSTWRIAYDERIDVTLKAGDQSQTAAISPLDGPVQMNGAIVDLGSLCWRPDMLCPQQVLPTETMILQVGRQLLVGFNRRGPLAALAQQAGLAASLDGREVTAPLNIAPADQGICGLGAASMLLATVGEAAEEDPEASTDPDETAEEETEGDPPSTADFMKGRINLAYTANCLILNGAAAMDPTVEVELSVGFTAKRY